MDGEEKGQRERERERDTDVRGYTHNADTSSVF